MTAKGHCDFRFCDYPNGLLMARQPPCTVAWRFPQAALEYVFNAYVSGF